VASAQQLDAQLVCLDFSKTVLVLALVQQPILLMLVQRIASPAMIKFRDAVPVHRSPLLAL
jgi:hypothetical protein